MISWLLFALEKRPWNLTRWLTRYSRTRLNQAQQYLKWWLVVVITQECSQGWGSQKRRTKGPNVQDRVVKSSNATIVMMKLTWRGIVPRKEGLEKWEAICIGIGECSNPFNGGDTLLAHAENLRKTYQILDSSWSFHICLVRALWYVSTT